MARGPSASVDINLSIQYILNNAGSMAGSCYGGSATGTYEYIKKSGNVPYDSCQPYIACSSDSSIGFCGSVDTTPSAINTCRTCSTFGVDCSAIDEYPNATISEYGTVTGADNMKSEIFARGPIACGVNAEVRLDEEQSDSNIPPINITKNLPLLAAFLSPSSTTRAGSSPTTSSPTRWSTT